MSRALDGIRVIDHGTFITGPFAAMLLADLGAEVIKVERAGDGDPYRSFKGGLYAPHFRANNRSKRSIALDMAKPEDQQVLQDLIASADVYIQNFRPGVAEKLGLGEAAMRARNPKLIYCSISGFGASGPYVKRPTYDTVAQGVSGFLSMFLDDRDPRVMGPAVADTITGLYAAYGVLGAIAQRALSGKASSVSLSMLEAMAHFASEPYANYFDSGKPWRAYDRASVSQSFALECADGGLVCLHLSSPPKFWEGLLAATGLAELAQDPRFATRMDRVAHHEALIAALRPVFRTRGRAEWLNLLEKHDVPHAPVLGLEEVMSDPQALHLGLEQTVTHPRQGNVRMVRNPISFDGDRSFHASAPPELDEHGAEIRSQLAQEACQGTKAQPPGH